MHQNVLEATRDIKTAMVIKDHRTAYDYSRTLRIEFAEEYTECSEIAASLSFGCSDYSIDVETDYYRWLDVITTLYLNAAPDTERGRKEVKQFRTIDSKAYASDQERKSALSDIIADHFLQCIKHLQSK